MFAAERYEKIKEVMTEHKKINVATLVDILQVSDVTVRKDLDKLEKEGFLEKTFGGAILVENNDDADEQVLNITEAIEHLADKRDIAQLAASQVDEGDTVFIGSGSTCYLLAKAIKKVKDITVVTNNVNALNELIPDVSQVFFIGGEIVYENGLTSTSSEKVEDYFEGIYVNKAFTSVTGVDIVAGLTVNHAISKFIFKEIQKMSAYWTLIVDESKFGKRGIYQVAPLESPDCIISNLIPEDYIRALTDKQIEVITSSD